MNHYDYHIINDVYFWMMSGKKTVEVRILKEKSAAIHPGDYITFTNLDNENQKVNVKVINKNMFENVDNLLEVYSPDMIMPDHNKEDIKKLLNDIYGDALYTSKLVAFEFELTEKV